MPQEIKVSNLTVTIPPNLEIVCKDELKKLHEQADMRCWWTKDEVVKRYHRGWNWISAMLYSPKFRPMLEGKCVFYGGKGTRRMYLFEPVGFSKFMRDYFPEITKELGHGINNVKKERIK